MKVRTVLTMIILLLTISLIGCSKGIPVKVNGKTVYLGGSSTEPEHIKEEKKPIIDQEEKQPEPTSPQAQKNLQQAKEGEYQPGYKWGMIGIDSKNKYQKWADHGFFTYEDIKAWYSVFPFDPAKAQEWRKAGFDPAVAYEWKQEWSFAQEAGMWIRLGLTSKGSKQWKQEGFSQSEAKSWRNDGFSLNEASRWKKQGYDRVEARKWKTAGFKDDDVQYADNWKNHGFTPQETKTLIAGGFEIHEDPPAKWKEAGISPEKAVTWKKSGFDNYDKGDRRSLKEWWKAGFLPAEAEQWVEANVSTSNAIIYKNKGISPTDKVRIQWEQRTSDFSLDDKSKWETSGYSYPYMMKLLNYKVTTKDLSLIKRSCPNQIDFGNMGFFAIKDPYRVKGKCYYYLGQKHLQPRGKEAIFRSGTSRKYYHAHLVFKSKIPSYIQAIVKGRDPVEMNSPSTGRTMIPSGQVIFVKFQK